MIDKFYSASEVAKIIGRSKQTIILWDKYSDIKEARGEERYIPRPLKTNNGRAWTKESVDRIKAFAESVSYGILAEFNRKKWGKRGKYD